MAKVIDGEDCCGFANGRSILYDQFVLPDLEISKNPVLPLQALHRIASPFARAKAPRSDLNVFESVPDSVRPAMASIVTQRPRTRINASVRFFSDAEWFYINDEDPFHPPVLKRLRPTLEYYDQRYPQSSCNLDAQRCFDDSVGGATSAPSLLLNLTLSGACPDEETISTSNSSLLLPSGIERHVCETLDGDMTPKAKYNRSVCRGFGFVRSGDCDDGFASSGRQAKTTKAHSSAPNLCMFSESANRGDIPENESRVLDSEAMHVCNREATLAARNNASGSLDEFSFGGEEADSDTENVDVDAMTPKASALTLQFGQCPLAMG